MLILKNKNLRSAFHTTTNNFFSPKSSLFFSPKQNLRKLPIMYVGSTLVYHATLGASD